MAAVQLTGLTKKFREVVAVSDVHLEITDAEFMVLVGPSGCGKTTVLRLIAGLEEPTAGEIRIGEQLVNDVSPKDRDIAMVFQNYALYPHMTVYDNMSFGLRLRKFKRDEIDRRVKRAAEMLGLQALLKRKPRELSGGQRQRVALGRAIVREPKVFLMDEPLSNLDAKMRVQTRAELIKLHRQLGITTIYVTHDQVEAMTMGQRIAVLNEGLVQQVDTPLNLYRNPANVFVAGFIGSPSMNFLEATIKGEDARLLVETEALRLALPAEAAERARPYVNKAVVFGIRPQDMFDRSMAPVEPNEGNMAQLHVDVIEPVGAEYILYLTSGRDTLVATVDAETRAQEQAPLDVVFDMAHAHLFDKETQATIV
jgi:multiple sugar transport system ATP-binding protein